MCDDAQVTLRRTVHFADDTAPGTLATDVLMPDARSQKTVTQLPPKCDVSVTPGAATVAPVQPTQTDTVSNTAAPTAIENRRVLVVEALLGDKPCSVMFDHWQRVFGSG